MIVSTRTLNYSGLGRCRDEWKRGLSGTAYCVDDDGHYYVPDDLGRGLRRGVLGAPREGLVLDGEERGEDSEDGHGSYGHDDAVVDPIS